MSVDPETIGAIIEGAAGLFGAGGGAAKRYSPTEKRAQLLAAARQYGYDSPEFKQLAAKWPRQAKKLEKFGQVAPAPLPSGAAQQPLGYVYDPFALDRGVPVGGYEVTAFPAKTGETWFDILSVFGGFSGVATGILRALFRRRAKQTLGEVVKKVASATARAKAKGLTGKGVRLEAEKILAAEAKSTAAKKIGPVAIKAATKAAKKQSGIARAVSAGTAAGAAAQIVQEIIARAHLPEAEAPEKPQGTGATATPPGGASAPSGAQSVGSIPVGSSPSGASAAPGQPRAAAAQGAAEKAAAARSATREAAERAKRNAAAFIAPPTPEWLTILLESAQRIGAPTKGERGGRPAEIPETPVEPLPLPAGGFGLTGFRPGGVGSCECKPKKPRGKRKKRTVCYTGRFTETATGTLKYEKRKRTSCLPSRKRPASQQAR